MNAILADIYWAGSLLPEITMILFTQSTVVLRKYSIVLKLLCHNSSLRLHRIAWEFHEFFTFREFPAYFRFVATLKAHSTCTGCLLPVEFPEGFRRCLPLSRRTRQNAPNLENLCKIGGNDDY